MGRQRNGSILCIGSNPIPLNLRCSVLEERGWDVASSASGHEGILRAEREPVHAVILDLDGDGTESALIAGELKRLRPEMRVIMVVETKENLSPGATLQADAVVLKAEESRRLPDVLKSILRTQ